MKKVWIAVVAASMTLSAAMQAFAGSWQQDPTRPANDNGVSNWRYQNDDGSFTTGCWAWIDGNLDGVAESYRFDDDGWMYASTNIDGYDVNGDGAWVSNGQVMTQGVWTPVNQPETPAVYSNQQTSEWLQDSRGRQYKNAKGELVTGWKKIDGNQYYFDGNGYALTGFQQAEGQDYYFTQTGELVKKTYHSVEEGVYYVIDKKEHYVVDVVSELDWKEYKKDLDTDSVELPDKSDQNQDGDAQEESEGSNLTDKEAYKKIIKLKSRYPEGKKWTNDNSHRSGYRMGYGCAGFAFLVQDEVFGEQAKKYQYDTFEWDSLRVGDHLRIYNSIGGEHSVIVLTMEDDFITICEGNYNSSIHWGRKMTMDELGDVFIYRETCYDE